MSLPVFYHYPDKSAFAYSIDVPNGAKVDFMKDGFVYAWQPCDPTEKFKIYPGFVGYVFKSVDFYNDFVRTGEECWSYRGGLDCRLHFKVGRGIHRWDDGDVYEGEFDTNHMHGQGVYTFKNGRKYVGEFKDDEPSGQGVMTWPDGTSFTGFFTEGTFDRSKPSEIVFSDGEMCKGRLDGRMKYLWDSINEYCILDMGKADPTYEGKPAAGGYWREAKIAKIEFENKKETNLDEADEEDENEEDEEDEEGENDKDEEDKEGENDKDEEGENEEDEANKWITNSTIFCNGCAASRPNILSQEITYFNCLKTCEFDRPSCIGCCQSLTNDDFYVSKVLKGVKCYRKVYLCKK
jgi:hypothetical protein